MTLPVVLGAIALKLATDLALDYLYPDSLADGTLPPTTPIPDTSIPYEPPFNGGQCNGVLYRIRVRSFNLAGVQDFTGVFEVYGSIGGIEIQGDGGGNNNRGFMRGSIGGARNFFAVSNVLTSSSISLENLGTVNPAIPDNCGNLPNPNQPSEVPPISNGGAPQNGTPAITPSDDLVEGGLPVLALPSILPALLGLAAQLGSAIAAAQAAADTLASIKAVADAVKKLAEQLDAHKEIFEKLRKYLNQKEKEEDAKKQYFIRQYGTIIRDGYLDITPRPASVGFKPLMLDFRCFNVPNGIGRFFGKDSYNWFRYQELGSICFLSPTSGVLSIHKIEHVRTSIAIPELAIGFTYNMGLNGIIRAKVSMLYTQEKP